MNAWSWRLKQALTLSDTTGLFVESGCIIKLGYSNVAELCTFAKKLLNCTLKMVEFYGNLYINKTL
jgi:hypothetical protein